jgi:hypothetical protein
MSAALLILHAAPDDSRALTAMRLAGALLIAAGDQAQ